MPQLNLKRFLITFVNPDGNEATIPIYGTTLAAAIESLGSYVGGDSQPTIVKVKKG